MFALIGGMSWVSSSYFYRLLSTHLKRNFILLHLDDTAFRHHLIQGQYDEAFACWEPFREFLQSPQISSFAICCNSAHVLEDRFETAVKKKMISLPHITLKSLCGQTSVGLLATSITLNQKLYHRFESIFGIHFIVPTSEEVKTLNILVYDHLTNKTPSKEDIRIVTEMEKRILSRGAECIILGCSELSMFYDHLDPHTTICPLRVLLGTLEYD